MATQKKQTKSDKVLPEIEKYYEAEKRERAGLAWILAIASVAMVAAALIGVFFGGRWIYRKYVGKTETTVAVETTSTSSDTQPSTSDDNGAAVEATENSSTSDSSSSDNSNTQSSSQTEQAATSSSTQNSATTTALANTGAENVLPIFVVSSFAGTILYRRKLSR